MAGPGGGPPRKSHTKSKKGCKTCKKRHIRCDENYPQCKNCTKHNVRCGYNDQIIQGEDVLGSPSTGFGLNPAPEQEIEQWVATGVFPFPELGVQNTSQFSHFGRTDLRLLHHLCNAYRMLTSVGAVHCAPWMSQLPVFLEISGRGHSCVLSALLAFSAQRLAVGSNAQEMANLADSYRAHALSTTQGAIGDFSQHNADSILATSIILSWQVDDLLSWNSLMSGISTVIQAMGDWRLASPIASFAESHVLARPSAVAGDIALPNAIAALQQMSESLPHENPVRSTLERTWQSGIELRSMSQTTSAQQVFEHLGCLRNRVLWAPLDLISHVGAGNLSMVALAQIFSMACAVDASIPDLNGASLGALTNIAIGDIDRQIRFGSPTSISSQDHWDGMMQFPRHIAQRFPPQDTQPEPIFSLTQHEGSISGSPYGFENLDLHSTPGTPPYPPALPYLESNDMSVPPSPYLAGYSGSNRHSGHFSHRPASIYSDRGSLSVPPSQNSPGFSPAYSTQLFSDPEAAGFFYGSEQPASNSPLEYTSGSPSLTRPADKANSYRQN